MVERNVGREIALILIATVVLGGGFAAWLLHSLEKPEPIEMTLSATGNVSGADRNAEELRARAAEWGRRLSARDYAGAHALMALAFRERVTVEAFTAMIAANAFLAGTEEIAIQRTTEQRAGTDPTTMALRGTGFLRSRAGAVEIVLHFVREPDGLHIVSALLAGVPVLQGIAPAPP